MVIQTMSNDKRVTIYYNEKNESEKLPVIIMHIYQEDSGGIWNKANKLTKKDFILVTISNINWNKEMTPWYMKTNWNQEDTYDGKADEYIQLLTTKIVPKIASIIENEINKQVERYIIAGYSLAGLFSVYSLYKTNLFTDAICCSGSLWYPNIQEFIENHDFMKLPNKIYFSLGDKESKTKNELLATVEEKTIIIDQYFKKKNIKTKFELNEGNHFQNIEERIAKGIAWILNT